MHVLLVRDDGLLLTRRRDVDTLHVNGSGPEPRLGLFSGAPCRLGTPANREPGKCSAVGWFRFDALPDRLIDYPAAGIHACRAATTSSTRGRTRPAAHSDPRGPVGVQVGQ